MRTRTALALAAVLTLAHNAHPARILGLFPHTGKSHQMVFEPLLQKLAETGHQVTVVSFFPQKNPIANYTDVSLEGLAPIGLATFDLAIYENPSKVLKFLGLYRLVKQMMEFDPLRGMALHTCSRLVSWEPLIDTLKKEYDLVLLENFNSDCMLGLLHVYGINVPKVAMLSSPPMPWTTERMGLIDNPSYMPIISTHRSGKLTFAERLENTFMQVYFKLWFRYGVQIKEQEIIEKHFGEKLPDLNSLAKNISLILVNTHHELNGVKPLLPGIVEVGGMHLNPTRKPIPQYIERFLNESTEGVVLFSFGSLIRTASIPEYKERMLVNVLSRLRQRVIWKYEDSDEEGTLEGNILKVKWIPQYELLQHPKVLAFIAHGGLLGMTEAISAGKPMVVVPFFGDQHLNADTAAGAGMARAVSYGDLTEDAFSKALEDVLSAEMRISARRVSSMWKDRQNQPMDTAIYWIERVLRWGDESKLYSVARELTFFEYSQLDVAAVLLLAIIVLLILLQVTLSAVFSMIFGSPKKKEKLH